ncbi:MAG: BON domain-containing protein [Gemmataceae bacterium]|nr:BON domain-containing protein [Gemmataceae bacterium]
MRRILYLAAIALGLGTTANVLAQGGVGGGTGAGGGTGGTGAGGGGGSTFAGGSGGTGGNSFTGGGTQSFTGGTGGTTGGGAGGRTGGGGGTGTGTTFTPSTTGIFAAYYSNPLYPGRPGSTNISNKTVGGFGQPSFGTATTSTRATTGQAGRAGTATARNQNTSNNKANIAPITYAMEVKFPAPVIVPTRLQADLQGLISRTSAIRTPGSVRVEVAGTVVILRGRVSDEDERRLVEGMVRLEPGVHEVQNELTIP